MMTVRYFRVTEMARLQKITTAPQHRSVLKVPASRSDRLHGVQRAGADVAVDDPHGADHADTLTRRELIM